MVCAEVRYYMASNIKDDDLEGWLSGLRHWS